MNPSVVFSESDVLLHLGYSLPNDKDIIEKDIFGSCRCVLMAGTNSRAKAIAKAFCDDSEAEPQNRSLTDRYALYSVGKVVTVSHGIGEGSIMVLLHELAKALYYAQPDNWQSIPWIRVGSCGGLGVPPGTVVITSQPLNGTLQPTMSMSILGQMRHFPAELDKDLSDELFRYAQTRPYLQDTVVGNTFCCPDFYESQARRDGAICRISEEEQQQFLKDLSSKHDVVNIEMESLPLAYTCTSLGIPAVVVSVALVNRLVQDTATASAEEIGTWIERPVRLAVDFAREVVLK